MKVALKPCYCEEKPCVCYDDRVEQAKQEAREDAERTRPTQTDARPRRARSVDKF